MLKFKIKPLQRILYLDNPLQISDGTIRYIDILIQISDKDSLPQYSYTNSWWKDSLPRHFDSVPWYDSLPWYSDTSYWWYDSWIRHSDAIHTVLYFDILIKYPNCKDSLPRYSDTILWWYDSLLRYSDTIN